MFHKAFDVFEHILFRSFDVNGTCTYQTVWNEITALGAAWQNMDGFTPTCLDRRSTASAGTKRRASNDLEPPRRRGLSLLHKLDAVIAAPTHAAVKVVKGKMNTVALGATSNTTDSDLSDYEDALMNV